MPKPRPQLRVTLSPSDGEIHVEGDTEAVKQFMEWYLDKVAKLQKAQQPQPEKEQQVKKAQSGTQTEKPSPMVEPKKIQPEVKADTIGLPSFAQDNPWIGILSKKR
jgi:acylphosphatase